MGLKLNLSASALLLPRPFLCLYLLYVAQVTWPADGLLVLDEVAQADVCHLQPVQVYLLLIVVGFFKADAVNSVEDVDAQGRIADLGDIALLQEIVPFKTL